jgi:hypothetical protein
MIIFCSSHVDGFSVDEGNVQNRQNTERTIHERTGFMPPRFTTKLK